MSYLNVLPSESAAAHADAGKLLFSLDTKVDTSKTVGYRAKHVYCVAPIMDYATTVIQYWAVGVDCCQGRGQFACGDVVDVKVGMVFFTCFFFGFGKGFRSAIWACWGWIM